MYLLCKTKITNNPSNGFTLIELICTLVLLGLIGTYFLGGYMNVARSHVNADENYQQTQKTQSALLRMILEMQGASSVSVTSNVITYTPYGSATARTISLSGTNLILHKNSEASDVNHVLTDNVSGFTASYSNSTVSYSLTTSFSGSVTKTFSTSAYLSN